MATEETLRIVITAENKSAIEGLKQVSSATQTFVNAQGNLVKGSNQAAQALTNVGRVAQDLPFGFIGIQNNLNPLLESFQRLKAETGTTGGALKALGSSLIGAGGIGLALSVASSAFLLFGDKLFDTGKKAQEAKKAIDDATASIAKDAAQVGILAEKYRDTNLSLGQRREILKQLNNISPEYFQGLKAEATTYADLRKASDAYTQSLAGQIKAKILSIELEKKVTDLFKVQEEQQKIIQLRQEFATKNKTGQPSQGDPRLAERIRLGERDVKLLEMRIAGLTKIQELEGKGNKESTRTEAVRAISVKVDNRPQEELAINDALRERLTLIGRIADELQRQQQNQQKKDFLIAGGVAPQKTQALAAYDQEQAARQQTLLGIEQSRISALDEMNKKFKDQMALGEGIANTFVNMLANIASAPDPFAAIGESLKRLAIDLAATVAKMLIIRAIMVAINPAAGAAKGIGGILGAAIGGVTPFATGGIVNGPTMGLVGEAGPEMILPLDRFKGFVDQAGKMGALSMANSGGGNGGQTGEFTIRGNDLVLALQRSNYSLGLRR